MYQIALITTRGEVGPLYGYRETMDFLEGYFGRLRRWHRPLMH
jgi:hypothetical protein